jgi:hypothetical protein
MRKLKLSFAVLAFVLCVSFAPAQAETIKIGLTGVVDSVGDSYNLLGGKIQANDIITGFYTYDSLMSNSAPEPEYEGWYQYTTSPYGMSLTVGDITFQTDSENVNFGIEVSNNFYGESRDIYVMNSNNNLSLANGLSIDNLHWQLDDYSGTALSDTALPLEPPDLSKWSNSLSIMGGQYPFPSPGEKTLFEIIGHVTEVHLVPEPISLCLLAFGGLFLRRKA